MTPADVVATRVRELRRRRGLTAQQLAEAMTKAGVPWSRGVVAKLENDRRGDKGVTVAELFALALVLEVAPTELLSPSSYDVGVAYGVTPTRVEEPARVREWLDMRVSLDDVIRVWKRMQVNDEFGDECRRVWFEDQDAHQQRVDLVRRVRAEASGSAAT